MKKLRTIKIALTVALSLLFVIEHDAQGFKNIDKVPLDISYYRESMASAPLIKVLYGRPTLKKKKAFGGQVPFNKIWRTGANEGTEIKFYKDVLFGDQLIKAGTYTLLTIPGKDQWDIILNKQLDVWGAFQYDPSQNVARIKVPVSTAERLDVFSIAFKRIKHEIHLVLGWDATRVKIPLQIEDIVVAKL